MLRNYIKIAWRNLLNNKIFSLINLLGLSIGMAAFWLIMIFVVSELSYDRHYENSDRIFRIVSHGKWNGGSFDITGTAGPMAETMKNEFPEIQEVTRLEAEGGGVIKYGDKLLKINDVFFADSSFFTVFSHHFLSGNPVSALSKPQSIVLTKELAIQIFGSPERAINKTIYFNNTPNQITAIIENVPENSHFTFSAIRSFSKGFAPDWSNFYLYTYVLLEHTRDHQALQQKMPGFVKKYLNDQGLNVDYALELQPLIDIHLHSNLSFELSTNRSIKFVYIFTFIGFLILVIAFINYINISTAKASTRLQEVAVRKIIGSTRKELVKLFLVESGIITIFSALFSIVLVQLFTPLLNQLTAKELHLWDYGIIRTLSILIPFTLFLSLTGGLYPALFFSRFKTVPALKNQMDKQHFQAIFRKSLVIFQFVIAVVMICATVVIYSQLNFMTKKDLGFDKNQVITFHLDNEHARLNGQNLKAELLKNPAIQEVAFAGNPIGNNNIGIGTYNVENNGIIDPNITMANNLTVDHAYIPTLHIQMHQGRNFNPSLTTDSNAIIINQAFAKKQGWTDAVGKRIQIGADANGKSLFKTVIGVVGDFHIYSLQHKIEPMVMVLPSSPTEMDNVYVRINKQNIEETIQFIENVFKNFDREVPFTFSFLDQNFKNQYESESRQGQLLFVFAIMTIGIACLGLFGLITFTTEQRIKEIGIRKTLGASTSRLVKLLCSDLLKLVGIAFLVAIPLSWLAMNQWLQNFAYRITISWEMIALSGIITILIATITLIIQAIKTASANPVDSLRNE